MLGTIYSATRQEIGRYNNLDWTISSYGLFLLSSVFVMSKQGYFLENVGAQFIFVFLVFAICIFFSYTRYKILVFVNKEREVQCEIEKFWKENNKLEEYQGKLFCDHAPSPFPKHYRPSWAIGQVMMIFIYGAYVEFELIKNILKIT